MKLLILHQMETEPHVLSELCETFFLFAAVFFCPGQTCSSHQVLSSSEPNWVSALAGTLLPTEAYISHEPSGV